MKCLQLCLAFFIFAVTNVYAKNLTVTVLYESLCPDSVNFLRDQFYPAYSTIKERINVELVPYGKATTKKVNGKWVFECQHKENECYGNKVHACAINIAPKVASTEFILCAMKSGDGSNNDTLKQCAGDKNITWSSIEACLKSGKGDDLLALNGNRTDALYPNLTFVPTIVFNNVYKDVLQRLAMRNFVDLTVLLLEEIKTTSGSDICTLSLLTLISSLFLLFRVYV